MVGFQKSLHATRSGKSEAKGKHQNLSFKKDLDPAIAKEIANDFLEKTRQFYSRIKIAGSIRRKELVVHDIDFAVIPVPENREIWKEKLTERIKQIGGRVASFGDLICNIRYRDVQINLFFGNEEGWGCTLMWATGPKGHTIGMTIKAQKKNLLYNSTGIWSRDDPPQLIGTSTEEEIAQILDWEFKPPEMRGKNASDGKLFY